MPSESILPRRVQVGIATLLSPDTARGILPSGELSPEKKIAITETMAYILPLLKIDGTGALKPRDDSGLLPYQSPTRLADAISRRFPRMQAFAESHFTRDESDQYFQDEAQLFRGITLGDVLIAAIVNDGRVLSTSHYQYVNAPAVTQATPFGEQAADYARGKSHDRVTAQRILYALQLDSLGYTADDVMRSILMSPVVLRFKFEGEYEARIDAYGIAGITPMTAMCGPVAGTPYVAAIPPFEVSGESTERCRQEFATQFGFDIQVLRRLAILAEDRHLGSN